MKINIALLLLITFSVCLLQCINSNTPKADARGGQYAGAETCMPCHKSIGNGYAHTNHFQTSSEVEFEKFKKLITPSNNTVAFPNNQLVRLEAKDDKITQSTIVNGKEVIGANMDIAFGSGEKAWTFGYWKDEQLYQLPLTYLSGMKRWTNSPGFPSDHPGYSRLIVVRCLECHSSYAAVENTVEQGMRFTEKIKPGSIIYGVDCERCHGPAAQHVAFHTENPEVKKATFMTSIKSLNRQQQLDLCATCHSGDPAKLKSIFSFKPGDALADYYMYYSGAVANPDAHGMQMQSLMQSQCFKQSNLTCMSCHNSHVNEGNSRGAFIQRCMSCHQKSQHSVDMKRTNNDCITCHMPLTASQSLNFNNSTEQQNISYKLNTHRIAIYP